MLSISYVSFRIHNFENENNWPFIRSQITCILYDALPCQIMVPYCLHTHCLVVIMDLYLACWRQGKISTVRSWVRSWDFKWFSGKVKVDCVCRSLLDQFMNWLYEFCCVREYCCWLLVSNVLIIFLFLSLCCLQD